MKIYSVNFTAPNGGDEIDRTTSRREAVESLKELQADKKSGLSYEIRLHRIPSDMLELTGVADFIDIETFTSCESINYNKEAAEYYEANYKVLAL